MTKAIKLGPQIREATFDRATMDEEERRIELSFSSEEPYERYWGIEILGHRAGEVDLDWLKTGNAPLLVDHRAGVDNQVGVIEKVRLDKGTGRAVVRFGKGNRADEIFTRVKDGELSNISVGYRINKMRLEEEDEEKSTYRVTDWRPTEISVVAIPADPTVGIGRAEEELREVQIEIEKVKEMSDTKKAVPEVGAEIHVRSEQPAPAPALDLEKEQQKWLKAERTRADEITAIGQTFNKGDIAQKAILDGLTVDEFRGKIIEMLGDDREEIMASKVEIGLTKQELKQYSYVKALAYAANPHEPKFAEYAAFELECSKAFADKNGRDVRGIVIPTDILRRPLVNPHTRDLNVTTATAGGHTVATELLADSFIDILRNRSVVMSLGARTLMDLQGNIAIPRQTGAATGEWVAESGSATESQQTFDQVTLSPKTATGFVDISRRLLLQSSIDVEAFVRNDLGRVIALLIDLAALYGSGAANQPTGVANQTGINTTTFAAADPTYAEVVAMESAVATDNANIGTLAYCTDAAMRGAFKTTEKATGTAQFIWEQGNTVNGRRTEISEQVTDGDVFYGNWDDLVIGMWSGLDLLLDPYTGGTAGTLRIIAHQDADIAVRHPVSFCLSNDGV